MADLLDIAPQQERVETVEVLGRPVEIRGLSVAQLAKLMRRFPDLRRSFFNADAPEDVRGAALLEAWPGIVAAGVGHPGEAPYEAAAERLPREELMKLGNAILALTNPSAPAEGSGPLVPAAEAAPLPVAGEEAA